MFPAWFPSRENPLNAIFTKRHIDVISEKNKVVVVYAEKSNLILANRYQIDIDVTNGYPIYICYFNPSKSKIKILRKLLNYLYKINAFLKAINSTNISIESYDFIHIHVVSYESIIPLFYKMFKDKNYFVSEHATGYLRNKNTFSLENVFRKIILKNSLGISAVSNSLKNAIENLVPRKENFPIIPNFVDEHKFTIQTKKKGEKIKFLHVSRLDEKAKNVIGIINAFKGLNNNQIELHIVGGFENQTSDAENYVNDNNLNENIFFHGVKLGDQILEYYHNCDVLVMFSNYETQGVVILEALFCGKPILATKLPCITEYLNSSNSVLVEPSDVDGLMRNMKMFIEGKWNIWDSETIALDIKNKFSRKFIEDEFFRYYNNGLKK